MSHLYAVRTGWEAERLARYLLSRFSFVAQPSTIADDVGSDFYCTIFDITDSSPQMVEPRTSFAIQVKSNGDRIEAHNKVQYLFHLEIPFSSVPVGIGTEDLFCGALSDDDRCSWHSGKAMVATRGQWRSPAMGGDGREIRSDDQLPSCLSDRCPDSP